MDTLRKERTREKMECTGLVELITRREQKIAGIAKQ